MSKLRVHLLLCKHNPRNKTQNDKPARDPRHVGFRDKANAFYLCQDTVLRYFDTNRYRYLWCVCALHPPALACESVCKASRVKFTQLKQEANASWKIVRSKTLQCDSLFGMAVLNAGAKSTRKPYFGTFGPIIIIIIIYI